MHKIIKLDKGISIFTFPKKLPKKFTIRNFCTWLHPWGKAPIKIVPVYKKSIAYIKMTILY